MHALGIEVGRIDQVILRGHEARIRKIQGFLEMPHSGPGMIDTVQAVMGYLGELGCRTELFPTRGNPIAYGELQVGAPVTVIVYLMYDTAPVLDAGDWSSPPFRGTVTEMPVGRVLAGRGSMARRGPLIAFLDALRSILDAGLPLPVNLLFVAEGDENVGSPHLSEFFGAYKDRLADAASTLFPAATQEAGGRVSIKLGAKGMIGLELACDGAVWGKGPGVVDLHWGDSAWVNSPMWRLTHALSSLVNLDGDVVLIDGFYENVVPPDSHELDLVQSLEFDAQKTLAKLGIQRFAGGTDGLDAFIRNLYEPAVVLQGAWGSVPPIKRLYRKAVARLDFRLIRNQTPDEVEAKVREHLARRGFGDISVTRTYAIPCSTVSAGDPLVRAAIDTYRAYGVEPELWPSQPKTPPTAIFGRPHVMVGVGHGGNHAAKDEYLLLEDRGELRGLTTLTQSFVRLLFTYARLKQEAA